MKTKTRKILTGLTGLVLGASTAVADLPDGGSHWFDSTSKTQELVRHIQNPEIRDEVVTQLYLQGSIDQFDPILPDVLDLLEERKKYVDASNLAEELNDKTEAARLYSKHIDSRLSNIEEINELELYSLGQSAERLGLNQKAKDIFNQVIEVLENTNNYERAGDIALEDLGNRERSESLYKIALENAVKTKDPLDDARLHMKLRNFDEADRIYSGEIERAEEICNFYRIQSLYRKRAEVAERKGDMEAKENLEKASNAFYSLYRLRVRCGDNDTKKAP